MATPVAELFTLASVFAEVAASDPISAVMLAVGAALTGVSVAVLGLLALGAAVDALIPGAG